jgi:hypothetical protein
MTDHYYMNPQTEAERRQCRNQIANEKRAFRIGVLFLCWVAASTYDYGTCVAMAHHDWPMTWSRDDGRYHRGSCAVLSLFGPFGILPMAMFSGLNASGWEP